MEDKENEMNQDEFVTFKELVLIQLRRVEGADSLAEAKAVAEETIAALRKKKEEQ